MRKLLLLLTLSISLLSFSQEKGKIRGGFDLGYATPFDGGGGISYSIEANYNISDNMKVGIRNNGAMLIKVVETSSENSSNAKISFNSGFTGTYDYFFNDGTTSFAPFIGGGVGYTRLGNIEVEGANSVDYSDLDAKFSGLIRGGFEYGKFRLTAEYNLVPETTFSTSPTKIKNSYFAISLGFYLGGGKWKK